MNLKRLIKVKDSEDKYSIGEDTKYFYSDSIKIQISSDFCAMYISYGGKAWSNNPEDAVILTTLKLSGGSFDKMFNRFIVSLENHSSVNLTDIAAALKLGYDVAKNF